MAKSKKKITVDFDDEDAVLAVMAKELDAPIEDLSIEVDRGLGHFRAGTIYKIDLGSKEYYVAENEESAHELAVAIVKQDLEESPEIFERNFIESHIDLDRLRRDLMSDVQNMRYEDLKEEADRRPEQFIKDNDLDWPKPSEKTIREYAEAASDEDTSASEIYERISGMTDAEDQWIELGEEPEVDDADIEKVATDEAEAQLKDPIAYLRDIYEDEAIKKAIEIAGIDEDAAAEEAVSVDGAGHFLASYDGNLNDAPGGLVYWRGN